MKSSLNLLFILGIIINVVINAVGASSINGYLNNEHSKTIKREAKKSKDEFYYMIFIKNKVNKDQKINKREAMEQFMNEIVDQINAIITENIDTYKYPSKLEEFKESPSSSSSLTKRDTQNDFAVPISSLDDRSIIYSYLSESVVELVEKIPNVIACVKDRPINFFMDGGNLKKSKDVHKMDRYNQILNETQWSGVSVRENADAHLSLISQGKFDSNLVGKYDKNYYYPSSAGHDIDVFILDSGFNFRHPEFFNKKERTVKCAAIVTRKSIIPSPSDDVCEVTNGKLIHGEAVSDIVGGLIHGVASKANIYGIALYTPPRNYGGEPDDDEEPSDSLLTEEEKKAHDNGIFISGVIRGLEYVEENLLRPNKAVFNTSIGIYLNKLLEEDKHIIEYWEMSINRTTEKGAVFVASAGNNSVDVMDNPNSYPYPCYFDNVICVGAINNSEKEIKSKRSHEEGSDEEEEESITLEEEVEEVEEIEEEEESNDEKIVKSKYYRTATFSNYGKKVDIYAPGFGTAEFLNINGENQVYVGAYGTSLSSPIVAGVAATIMSENPDIQFNTKKMLEYLTNIGEKNIIEGIKEGNPNVFINNGKHVVYSANDKYYGCGIRSGYHTCAVGSLCNTEGYCTASN